MLSVFPPMKFISASQSHLCSFPINLLLQFVISFTIRTSKPKEKSSIWLRSSEIIRLIVPCSEPLPPNRLFQFMLVSNLFKFSSDLLGEYLR